MEDFELGSDYQYPSPPEELSEFKALVLTTGANEERAIIEHVDKFFELVLNEYGFGPGLYFAQKQIKSLGWEAPLEGFHPSDDVIHQLLLHDRLIACVLDRRNMGNYHEVSFMQCPPLQSLLEWVEQTKEGVTDRARLGYGGHLRSR